jgi:hypothetical protein
MHWPFPPTPKIGTNLPGNYREAEKQFDRRVKTQFPVGISETLLIERLRDQGFRIDYNKGNWKSATITQGMIIKTLWSVRWRSQGEQVDEIWGIYGAIAP